ncbi:MAG: NAD-dependent deacylase [Pseudomonadota bacterium]
MPSFYGRSINTIVVLTGAGISAESGLQTFRDADGLWEGYDPMAIATPEAFAANPELVYRFYNARRRQLSDVHPNSAHRALARLQHEFSGTVFLVTQNVDDLHERGGSDQVCHMHGQLNFMSCQHCLAQMPVLADYDAQTACPDCGTVGKLRPDVVWFGEMPYHMSRISAQLASCDLFVAIGTSGAVYPAAGFVQEARLAGAITVEINKAISDVSGHFHQQRQGLASHEVAALVEELL